MTAHVRQPVRCCFYQLRRIKIIRRFIPTSTASLSPGLTTGGSADLSARADNLHPVLSSAARLMYGGTPSDHVTDLLRDNLHWLRVPQRITYKLCLITYKAINN